MTNFLGTAAVAMCLSCRCAPRRDRFDGYCRGCREEAEREAEQEFGGAGALAAHREVQEWLDDPAADPRAFMLVDEEWIKRERVTIHAAEPKRRPSRLRKTLPAQAPAERYLTLAEAGALVRASPETVRYWIWQGRLKGFKPGRTVLVRE